MSIFDEELRARESKVRDLEQARKVKGIYRDAVKTPQVILNVSRYGQSPEHVKAHLMYLTEREKETLELEDPNGNMLGSEQEFDDLIKQWTKDEKVYKFKNSDRVNRLTANIVLSAPEGSNRKAVTEAVREFARKEFGETNDYVFAKHEDTKNSHAHLVLKLRGYDGKKIRLGKQKLFELRQSLAESMRERGVGVTASYRTERGQWFKGVKQPIVHMRKRMRLENDKNAVKEAAQDLAKPKDKPWEKAMEKKRASLKKKYGELADSFELKEDKGSKGIGAAIRGFAESIPKVETRNDQLKVELVKNKTKDSDRER